MILLDANVLVYSIMGGAPQHRDSRGVVLRAASGELPGVLVAQVVNEAYSIVTSPRRVNRPLSPPQANRWLKGLRRVLSVKPVIPEALDELDSLLASQPRVGADVFDLFLVAQMRCHRIADICTYNVDDFALPGVRALAPTRL